jgi:hypothetical protein
MGTVLDNSKAMFRIPKNKTSWIFVESPGRGPTRGPQRAVIWQQRSDILNLSFERKERILICILGLRREVDPAVAVIIEVLLRLSLVGVAAAPMS